MELAELAAAFVRAADELERLHRLYREYVNHPEDGRYPAEWRIPDVLEHGPAEAAVVAAWEVKGIAWNRLRAALGLPDPLPPLEPPQRYPIRVVGKDTRL